MIVTGIAILIILFIIADFFAWRSYVRELEKAFGK